ncbi:MAG: hypothetical protein Q9173_003112 [Seirophora scorigena]
MPGWQLLFCISLLLVGQTIAARWPGWVVSQYAGNQTESAWFTGCHNRTSAGQENTTFAYISTQQACLDWYYWDGLTDNWQGTTCNNMGFFRGSQAYNNSRDCYTNCYGCLSVSIQAGSVDAICRDAHGRSTEWLLKGEQDVPSE